MTLLHHDQLHNLGHVTFSSDFTCTVADAHFRSNSSSDSEVIKSSSKISWQ